jgi:hypothetical protein
MGASKQAMRAGNAFVEWSMKDAALRKGLASIENRFRSIGSSLSSIGKVGLAVGGAIGGALAFPIKAASDLQETMNKFDVVFGDNSQAVKQWGDQYAATIGRSQKQIAEFLSNSQDLFIPLGFEPGAATDLSKQVTQLAFDLASFNNTADGEAIRDMHAALTGSGEVMKKYGVVLSEAAVQQELLNQGLDAKAATNQQKVQARLNIIMAGTTAAQGDAIRSAGGFANQMKGLQGVLFDTAAAIGDAILPYVTAFVTAVRAAATTVRDWISENPGLIQGIAIAGAVVAALGAVLLATGVAFQAVAFAAAGLSAAIGVVGAVIGAILSPMGLIVAAIVGGGAAFVTMTEAGQAMSDSLSGWLGGLSETVTQAFGAIKAALAAGDIEAAAGVLWAALKLIWLQGTAGLREKWHEFTGAIAKVWHTVWAGMQQLANTVWGNLERAWSHSSEFFATLWDTTTANVANVWDGFVGGIQRAWNQCVAFIERTWARIKGLFGGDATDEINRINSELEKSNAEISRRTGERQTERNNGVANRAAERNAAAAADRQASRDQQNATLDAIGADLAAKLAAADDGTAASIAAAEAALAEAKGKFQQATAAADEAAKLAEKPSEEQQVAAAAAESGGGAAQRTATSSGSFSAAVAALSLQSSSIDEEMLDVEQQMLASLQRMERAPAATLKAGA